MKMFLSSPIVVFKESFRNTSPMDYPDAAKLQAIGYITDGLCMRGDSLDSLDSITRDEALNALRWLYRQWTL
jgi:hypothetical protein